jgi:hypothetical protein
MSTSLLPLPSLGSLGVGILQKVLDASLPSGMLTITDDASGLSVGLTLSGGQTINIDDLSANAQGLSGRLFIDGLDANPLSATIADGFTIALTAFDVTLANSGLAASHIGGHFTIPFFTDASGNPKTVDVELTFKADGTLSISLSAVETVQSSTSDGLVQLQYALPGGLGNVEIDVASLEIDRSPDGTWRIVISGNLIIDAASLSWPSIELRGLGIDSKGNISLEGGWIDLPSQMAIDFYGFHLGLQKLGFGSDPTGKWIGFNGDINLVEGLSLGGSVRGLRINLSTGAVSLDGVGISFAIPDVLTIDGEIDHIHVDANSAADLSNAGLNPSIFNSIAPVGSIAPAGGKKVDVFAGQVKVVIQAVGGLEIDAAFIVGNFGGQSVFFLDLDAELPVGIPIFLDVSLYGLQGLIATGLEPHPEPQNTWWEWYKYPQGSSGPDLSQPADYTATDVNKWLAPKAGAFAIGAGATIGTSADDGFTVSAAIMLVLLLPGPVISLIGKANILSKRLGGAAEDANFEAMATFDGNAGTFDLTIDAHYEIPVVLDIEATAELFVDAGSGEWFFAIGKPPHEQRVKARIFDLFEVDAYFVVSDQGLITGTWAGYKGSWSFGPLSVSLDAYLATLAAIQWSPLQIAGGIELHGDIHLSAFGIGMGITADALLEACAPNPFWVHGELSVELDLPWPLPNIGATISLTWGGDDGTIPPAPLALSHIDATLIDHSDSASKRAGDHYVLLAHRSGGPFPDLPVSYDDPDRPGILNLTGQSLSNWQARVSPSDPSTILPDLAPDNTSDTQLAPVVPQDAHFTLSFAHPIVDMTGGGFQNALAASSLPAEIVTTAPPPPPAALGADDMSNININPASPSVQFTLRHSLTEVSFYEYDGGNWNEVCSVQPAPPSEQNATLGVTYLSGVWLAPAKSDPRQKQNQLKVFPWQLLAGQSWSATWNGQSSLQASGSSFSDQGLQFTTQGIAATVIAAYNYGSIQPGLQFQPDYAQKTNAVTLHFPEAVVLNSVTALIFVRDGEFFSIDPPQCVGDGVNLTPSSSSQDAGTGAYTLSFPENGTPIQTLSMTVSGIVLILYEVDYASPPAPMAVLPDAPALYAIKTVTKIEAARVGGGTPSYQTVPDGYPIVEFTYFQTASGPGTGEIGLKPPPVPPSPGQPALYPQLSANCTSMQQPPAASPLGGALDDLHTYTQWSWPQDGAAAAYYGYDVNVEFVESYVNALYTAFSNGSIPDSLHFRCVDRNHNHTLLFPLAIHVPSIPQQSALVAGAVNIQIPAAITGAAETTGLLYATRVGPQPEQVVALQQRAAQVDLSSTLPDTTAMWSMRADSPELIQKMLLGGRGNTFLVSQISPVMAGQMLHELEEQKAAAAAQLLWFKPLYPQTRYTLDVVAGPLLRDKRASTLAQGASASSLQTVFTAHDAIGLLQALQQYFAYEDALTTLERVEFTTSRYATFTSQMENAIAQLAGAAGATPMRHYASSFDSDTWAADPANGVSASAYETAVTQYTLSRDALHEVAAQFDPLSDDLQPDSSPAAHGNAALVAARQATAMAWAIAQQPIHALFDSLIAALGLPGLAGRVKPVAVPDTEISIVTDEGGNTVKAILLESPEALPWQRIWTSVQWTPAASWSVGKPAHAVLWNADGTKGVILLSRAANGPFNLSITFKGNLGPELPCITQNGVGVTEVVTIGSISLGPVYFRVPQQYGAVPSPAR